MDPSMVIFNNTYIDFHFPTVVDSIKIAGFSYPLGIASI